MKLFFGKGRARPVHAPEDVKGYLRPDRQKHYRDGYSMAELAKLWTRTPDRLPPRIAEKVGGDELDAGHFEYSVPVWGRGSSETDLMAFSQARVIAIEAKADEPFDDLVRVWIDREAAKNPKSPAHRRAVAQRYADALCQGSLDAILEIRYQLLHRTLSAAKAARRAGAAEAWMIVQHFPVCGRVARLSTAMEDFDRFRLLVGESPVLEQQRVRVAWITENAQGLS